MDTEGQLFVSHQHLQELSGRAYPKHIIRWLSENGYRFDVGADGWPKVLLRQLEERQGLRPTPAPRARERPDFSAIRRAG